MAAEIPSPNQPWIDHIGKPLQVFYQKMDKFAKLNFGQLTNAANDTAAAAAGVAIGQLYRNGSVVQIRVT